MNRTSVSRRNLVASAALLGGGVGASLGAASSHAGSLGPTIDLTNAADMLAVLARLHGNIAPGRPRFDWFDGTVSLVSAAGDLRTLCGISGYGEARIAPSDDGRGTWTCRRRVFANYTDLESGSVAPALQNPLTGAWVTPRGFTPETRYTLSAETPNVQWRRDGDVVLIEETSAAAASPLPGRAKTTRSLSMADIQDHNLTTLRDTGTWRVVTPWLPWLEMGQAPGHCLIECLRGGGAMTLSELPARIVNALEIHGFRES
jgi:hypothetical protein